VHSSQEAALAASLTTVPVQVAALPPHLPHTGPVPPAGAEVAEVAGGGAAGGGGAARAGAGGRGGAGAGGGRAARGRGGGRGRAGGAGAGVEPVAGRGRVAGGEPMAGTGPVVGAGPVAGAGPGGPRHRLLFFGMVRRYKGLDLLLRALAEAGPQISLTV